VVSFDSSPETLAPMAEGRPLDGARAATTSPASSGRGSSSGSVYWIYRICFVNIFFIARRSPVMSRHSTPEQTAENLSPRRTQPEPTAGTADRASSRSRRAFLLGGAAAAGALVALPAGEAQARNGISVADQFRGIQRHENAHVAFLVQALGDS